jgi:hypothetical protein
MYVHSTSFLVVRCRRLDANIPSMRIVQVFVQIYVSLNKVFHLWVCNGGTHLLTTFQLRMV